MVYIQDHTAKQGVVRSFYDKNAHVALQAAQNYGEVFTLPQFLQLRSTLPFDDLLWNIPVTLQTEEIFGKNQQGDPVAIMVHGAGLLSPERIQAGIKLEDFTDDPPHHGLTRTKSGLGEHALKLEEQEIFDLLEGKTPGMLVYSFLDYLLYSNHSSKMHGLFRDHADLIDLKNGHYAQNILADDSRAIALAGGRDKLIAYFDMLGTDSMGYTTVSPYVDFNQPQGRFLQVHGKNQLVYSSMQMDGPARFLAIKRDELQEKIDKHLVLDH